MTPSLNRRASWSPPVAQRVATWATFPSGDVHEPTSWVGRERDCPALALPGLPAPQDAADRTLRILSRRDDHAVASRVRDREGCVEATALWLDPLARAEGADADEPLRTCEAERCEVESRVDAVPGSTTEARPEHGADRRCAVGDDREVAGGEARSEDDGGVVAGGSTQVGESVDGGAHAGGKPGCRDVGAEHLRQERGWIGVVELRLQGCQLNARRRVPEGSSDVGDGHGAYIDTERRELLAQRVCELPGSIVTARYSHADGDAPTTCEDLCTLRPGRCESRCRCSSDGRRQESSGRRLVRQVRKRRSIESGRDGAA